MDVSEPRLVALIDWYQTLAPETLGEVGMHYAENAHFRDPFNDVSGIVAIRRIFEEMFRRLEQPRFEITDCTTGAHSAMLTWRFSFGLALRETSVAGATHLRFDASGLICEHRDYWDPVAELLLPRPLLGFPFRWLYRRLAG